jgi:hypothetical protein
VRPELSAYLAGVEEMARLREQGIELHDVSAVELGRAVHAAEPLPTATDLAELLAQIEQRNQAIRRDLETAPERVHGARHDGTGTSGLDGVEHPGHAARAVQGTRDRKMTIEDFVAEEMDREQFPE